MEVLHDCDIPLCVNPTHLFLGTQKDNVADCMAKGRIAAGERQSAAVPKGEAHHSAKYTEQCVLEVRKRAIAGEGNGEIARALGMQIQTVRRMVTRAAWKHVAP